jgi:hypothetical protein
MESPVRWAAATLSDIGTDYYTALLSEKTIALGRGFSVIREVKIPATSQKTRQETGSSVPNARDTEA